MELKLMMPKVTEWESNHSIGHTNRASGYYQYWNVLRGDDFVTETIADFKNENIPDFRRDSWSTIKQQIKNIDDVAIKTTKIKPVRIGDFHEHETVQRLTNDGHYSVKRLIDGKVVGGYEASPVERKLMTGFKGKVEKLAMKIGTDANGCERPVLRRVSGFMIDMLRKIK